MGDPQLAKRRLEHVFGGPVPLHVALGYANELIRSANVHQVDCATRLAIATAVAAWAEEAADELE